MAIIRRRNPGEVTRESWDPFAMMQELLSWDPWRERTEGALERTFAPAFEVKETRDAYVFKADLPGIKEEDLDVSLTGNRLTVSGKREEERRDENERFFAYERSFGSFSRSFTLPEGVDAEHVNAELKEGVLTLTMPKKPEVQPKRISVQRGGGEKPLKA